MSITTTQKIIKIGSSMGITLPAKELKKLGVNTSDEVEVTIRKKTTTADDKEVLAAATSILKRYKQDFTNLANR